MPEKTCFVVMGFGEKVDYQTQRTLDLDKTYKGIIKPAVEESGLKCVRADDIIHSGVIDKPMYELLLDAELVIADLSTANPNAIYELGVRHALRPNTTIILVEDQFKFPFDLDHILMRTYQHLGKGIDFEEVERVKAHLKEAIGELVHDAAAVDSPVYEYLDIEQPKRIAEPPDEPDDPRGAGPGAGGEAVSSLLDAAQAARGREDFASAEALFKAVFDKLREMNRFDAYVVQQWALATYKRKHQDDEGTLQALLDAHEILREHLDPARTNDPETLGIWGAIHKRLWELRGQRSDLDMAVWAYERGYYLKRDYYNGINYAFVLNVRAKEQAEPEERTADQVLARRVRKEVLHLVDEAERTMPRDENRAPLDVREAYWVAATRLEALKGLGDARLDEASEALFANAPEPWMPATTQGQLARLDKLL